MRGAGFITATLIFRCPPLSNSAHCRRRLHDHTHGFGYIMVMSMTSLPSLPNSRCLSNRPLKLPIPTSYINSFSIWKSNTGGRSLGRKGLVSQLPKRRSQVAPNIWCAGISYLFNTSPSRCCDAAMH
ncbi:hypothetical protein F4774DRAFT_393152 [Daldinia eschscholtzii]|nr:hypothetical protein F4774DRAFT_393152 [Daldinia eschscholtzii]